jgi:hypothetical protein
VYGRRARGVVLVVAERGVPEATELAGAYRKPQAMAALPALR